MSAVVIRSFEPSDAEWLVQQHRELYARDEGFDDSFGDLVAEIVEDFVENHNPDRESGWIAERDGDRLGSIFCVSLSEETAKLRLFLVKPEVRGSGLAQRLLETCTGFAREIGCREMVLWTHESHRAACALYRRNGWTLMSSEPARSFGVDVVEQHWRTDL
ncbi:MAG: GNAT family N-acetyltransferase [Heliomarina sp.]|uniref:GNAT family N-acetyltransferase n=1 Tax=Heliomarina sp. TaxID=2917556 RepID=UPI004057E3F7